VADVLVVAARQLGHPITDVVLVVPGDRLLHDPSVPTDLGARSADLPYVSRLATAVGPKVDRVHGLAYYLSNCSICSIKSMEGPMASSGSARSVGRPKSAGSEETRRALVAAAVDALRENGFGGASAREIAQRAGCNQGLVFYHFGSVVNLLLAALDDVSSARLAQYEEAVAAPPGLAGLIDAARAVFEEDLRAGYIAVLAEMMAGASSTPGLGAEVANRIAPWRAFAADAVRRSMAGTVLADTALAELAPPEEVAHGIVALYLGLEMLAHLDGDASPALALFDRAGRLAGLLQLLGGPAAPEPPTATIPEPSTAPKEER
jgi:AcrR family transcriptional regulator